uniref:Group I intronic ORF n=1 Tax=Volvocales sp. NrCl902 TaxID=2682054 RepID=A0A7G1GG78_9CHLO|nr:group I intronic ORF [Volvocales sp. NrCl902]
MVKGADGKEYALSAPWILGFADGESTLSFNLIKNVELTVGFQIQAVFIIVQGETDYYLLTAIANFFGYGTVSVNRKDETSVRYQYRVVDTEILTKLFIPFFKVIRFLTKKSVEFTHWSQWFEYLYNKKHYSDWPNGMLALLEGLKQFKLCGYPTLKAISFIETCDNFIEKTQKSPKPKV